METKFTPGPWEASISVLGEGTIFAGNDDIALVYVTDGADEPKAYPAAANAHLMAAAPDLLASLKEMLDVYWGAGDGQKPDPECIIAAKAAIAKAIGTEPFPGKSHFGG